MRFTFTALFALAPLAAGNAVYDLVKEFPNIKSTDSVAYSLWRQSFVEAQKDYIVSYFDEYGPGGYSSEEVSSIKSQVFANADSEATESYDFFYNAFVATEVAYDVATETGDGN